MNCLVCRYWHRGNFDEVRGHHPECPVANPDVAVPEMSRGMRLLGKFVCDNGVEIPMVEPKDAIRKDGMTEHKKSSRGEGKRK